MLQKRLIILLSLLILLPTLIIGGMAYHFATDNIRNERIKVVSRVAEGRHEQLQMVLQRADNRANAFLAEVLVKCVVAEQLDSLCAKSLLGNYLLTENADGAIIFRPDSDARFSIGNPGIQLDGLGEFKSGQLAGVSSPSSTPLRSIYVIARGDKLAWQLVVSYPLDLIQTIFAAHPELGRSGETFLADSNGFFITAARYPTTQGYSHPIDAKPMRACLSQQNGELMANGDLY